MKKYIITLAFLTAAFVVKAQVVNEGTLKIESGTDVYFMDNYTNKVGATHDNEGNLHLKGNLTNHGSMTVPTSGTTYFDSKPTDTNVDTQTIDGDVKEVHFYNLEVNNTHASVKGLAVSDEFNLQVENNLALTSGKLRLMGGSQLIQKHTGVTANSGTGHLLKDQDGAQNAYRYNDWSSPVHTEGATTYKVTTVLKDGTTPDLWTPTQVGFTTNKNGNQNNPVELSTRWMYRYENAGIDPINDTGWFSLFNLGTTTESSHAEMKPAEGYTMKGTNISATYADRQNYTFEGIPNDGDYNVTISDGEREYLVGNPYPSAMDADEFIRNNTSDLGAGHEIINGTIYFYEHWSTDTHFWRYYGGGYAEYSLSGGNPASQDPSYDLYSGGGTGTVTPKQFIPVGQGFYVRTGPVGGSGGHGGDVIFNNGQRAFKLEGAESEQTKHTNNTNGVTSRIRLDYTDPDGRIRHVMLAFTDGVATDFYDICYDGVMINPGDDDMYFIIGESDSMNKTPFSIQGVGPYDINSQYPIVVRTGKTGKHLITIKELENFDYDIYIQDEKGRTHDLRENDYLFISHAGDDYTQLKLVFKPNVTTGIQEILNNDIRTYYNEDEIIILNNKSIPISALQVYNTLGQVVYQTSDKSMLNDIEAHIPFANYAYSAYIIKLHTDLGVGTFKFLNN